MARTVAALSIVASLLGDLARAEPRGRDAPQPPRQRDNAIYEIGLALDGGLVRGLLPPGLRALPGTSGGIAAYRLGPSALSYVWVDVMGHDSASGAAARYLLGGLYTAAEGFEGSATILPGALRVRGGDGIVRISGGPAPERRDGAAGSVAFEIAPRDGPARHDRAVTHYIHDSGAAGLVLVVATAVFDWKDALPVAAEAAPLAGTAGVRGVSWAGVAQNVRFHPVAVSRFQGGPPRGA